MCIMSDTVLEVVVSIYNLKVQCVELSGIQWNGLGRNGPYHS